MKTSAFQLIAPFLCAACLSLAIPSSADAAMDGFKQLISTTQMKADAANEEALQGADKQRELIKKQAELRKVQIQFEGAAAPASDGIVEAIAAIAEHESTASVDGLDDAELKRLAELIGLAQQRVDAAIANASTQIASAKKVLAEATARDEKVSAKLHLKSLRAVVKAHRQTSVALKTLAKRVAG